MSKKTVRWIVLAAATLLLPLGFPKIGILRVYASLIFRLLNETIWKKRFEHLEILSFSGMSLLVIERHLIYQTGFLFGFGLSFIMLFSRGLIERKGKRLKPFFVAVLIQGFLLPISLFEGGFHVFQVFFNAVSILFSSIFGLIGLFSFITWPFPSLINGMAIFLETFFSFLRSIDVYVSLPPLSGWFCLVYYLTLGFGLYCEEIGMNPYRNKVYGIVFSLYLIGLIPVVPSLSQEVSFINVGQGDSIMIRDGFTTVLIDTGGNIGFDMATESLIPYFLKKRIYKIDCLIASHGDYDHIGAKESLMENFRIGRFVQGPESFPLQIGGLLFTNFNTYEESGENEKSLVLSLDFMDRKWLFTGDAPIEIEEKIIRDWPDLDCDVLKLGHHGSDTSSSLSFLQTVNPKEAVISVGAKNRYGHPSASVLKRLASLGIKVRRTDVEGTITYRKAKPFWL